MSACISREGEYGEHRLATEGAAGARFVCSRCFVFDEAFAIAEIDRLTDLLASSAPATVSEGATLSDSDTDSVTSSDGDRGMSEEWGHAHADDPEVVVVTSEASARSAVAGWNSARGTDGKGRLMRRVVGPWEVVGDE